MQRGFDKLDIDLKFIDLAMQIFKLIEEEIKKRSQLAFNDCSHMEDKYLKKLHVVFDDDKELVGVDAFIYIWKRTDGYAWLGRFVGLPIIKQCAVFAYSILAFLLFWRFKIFNKS